MGKAQKFLKKLNWLVFTLISPFGYSYILFGELHRKLVTVLNWLIYTFKVIIKENLGILSPLIYPLIPSSSAPFQALHLLNSFLIAHPQIEMLLQIWDVFFLSLITVFSVIPKYSATCL